MATKLEMEEYLYRRAIDIIESNDADIVKENLLFQEVWIPLAELYKDKIIPPKAEGKEQQETQILELKYQFNGYSRVSVLGRILPVTPSTCASVLCIDQTLIGIMMTDLYWPIAEVLVYVLHRPVEMAVLSRHWNMLTFK